MKMVLLLLSLALIPVGAAFAEETAAEPASSESNAACVDCKAASEPITDIEIVDPNKPIIRLELIPKDDRPESSMPQNLRTPRSKWSILVNPIS